MPEPVFDPHIPCLLSPQALAGGAARCVCSVNERALRNYEQGRALPPMTDRQRTWCLREVDAHGGLIAETAPDAELAQAVLDAWASADDELVGFD